MYVDAAYSYRPGSMVYQSVTVVGPAKTDDSIELPFGLGIRVGPGNHELDGGPDHTIGRGNFKGGRGDPL